MSRRVRVQRGYYSGFEWGMSHPCQIHPLSISDSSVSMSFLCQIPLKKIAGGSVQQEYQIDQDVKGVLQTHLCVCAALRLVFIVACIVTDAAACILLHVYCSS